MFLTPSEVVANPCKDLLSHPVQCFQEMFFATPAVVGTFFLGIGGFAVAVAIWGAIFAVVLFTLLYVIRLVFRGLHYFFHQTKVGQRVASFVPFKSYMQKFCCKAQEVQPKRLINTQAVSDYGANIVSKVHVDSKWFKSAFKHVPFSRSADSDNGASHKSPSKTPQRSTSRLSSLTPKLLSPKSLKQQ